MTMFCMCVHFLLGYLTIWNTWDCKEVFICSAMDIFTYPHMWRPAVGQEFKRAGYLKTGGGRLLLQMYRYVTVLPPRQEFKRAGYLKDGGGRAAVTDV